MVLGDSLFNKYYNKAQSPFICTIYMLSGINRWRYLVEIAASLLEAITIISTTTTTTTEVTFSPFNINFEIRK